MGKGGGGLGRSFTKTSIKELKTVDFRPCKVHNSVYIYTYVHHVSSACLNKYCGRISSVGRALSCRVGGHRFDSHNQTNTQHLQMQRD